MNQQKGDEFLDKIWHGELSDLYILADVATYSTYLSYVYMHAYLHVLLHNYVQYMCP